ncbi:dual 3',5'-cyclic-AMP and -GMP phosphodiesterase 11, partial [Caerostris darwini]
MVESCLSFYAIPQDMVHESSRLAITNYGTAAPVRKTSALELESKTDFLRSILNTTSDSISTFLSLPLSGDAVPLCNSTRCYAVRKILQQLGALSYERGIIFELVKDINDRLELNSLCHKILQNISIFTNVVKCHLFLVKGEKSDLNRCLVSQLFDVLHNSTIEEMQLKGVICIPLGIVSQVAEYREALNIPDCYKECHIPSTEMYKLHDLKFDYFSLNDKEMLKACLRIFMDLGFIQRFGIEYDVLNLCHRLGELETLSLLIACLCHGLDHRGTNNTFLKNSPLAQLYSNSTMEHNHFDQCITILNSEGTQILSHLSSEEYTNVVHVLDDAILATDLTVYYKAMLMTACDIAAITKPWEIQKK